MKCLSACLVFLVVTIHAGAAKSEDFSYEEWRAQLRQQGLFDETYMVAMRDGVRLSTTVHKSPLGGPFPAILVRTPYGKDDGRLQPLQLLVLAGYALVIQDVRGRFGSEGSDMVFVSDGWGDLQDGYDTVEWIAGQSWCDGNVGTWGPSAMGITQEMMAPSNPPHLVCQVVGYAASSVYGQASYQNGVFRKALVEGWFESTNLLHWLPTFLEHPTFDELWAQMDVESNVDKINVPALYIGGWYDCFQQGTLNGFQGRQESGLPGTRGRNQLVIGPWTHVGEFDLNQGQLTYPDNSLFSSEIDDTVAWFDYWLRGKQNGTSNDPTVRYYVMGDVTDPKAPGNEWRSGDRLPVPDHPTPLYLGQNKSLSLLPSNSGTMELILNPDNPVPTLGGANLNLPAGPFDQSSLESRDDVLVFSTGVLEEPVEVIGPVKAILYAETNLADNDLTVRLTDVYPDGRSMLVCDGIARASFRDSRTDPTPIDPGQVYRYEVDCWSTSLVFNRGHRIRILVAHTNYPRFDLNPVYQQLGRDGIPSEAKTKIHLSSNYPSHLLLPITDGTITPVMDWQAYD